MRSSQRRKELPNPAIADVLRELGFDGDIPPGGGWRTILCPFHQERRPSARVNSDVNAFYCNACGVQGDAIKLLETQLGLSVAEAIEKARQLAGEEVRPNSRPKRKRRASDLLK